MPYYLASFTLNQNYFAASDEQRAALTRQEIDHGKKLFKVGIWRHAYATAGSVKTHSWAIYRTSSEEDLARYLEEYPMAKAAMYSRDIYEVTIVDPPWIVGVVFAMLRSIGLYKPWTPSPLKQSAGVMRT